MLDTGPLEIPIKKLIKDLKLESEIEILNNVSNDRLLNLYNSSDLFVLPSIIDSQGNMEGLGVVLLEAMACKVPVIGTNIGGIPDIIQDNETGLLVPQKNILRLSSAINIMINNKSLRKQIANNGYCSVQNKFNWKKIANHYLKIYKHQITEHNY